MNNFNQRMGMKKGDYGTDSFRISKLSYFYWPFVLSRDKGLSVNH
jgi:hypothetical protein